MATETFDVIVVGARCAGAALAVRLARAGRSVALLEAARMPSGQRTSTHLIQPPGMDELDDLALGDIVRRQTPALSHARLGYDKYEVRLPYGENRTAHCLRREKLDPLLGEAARTAGADLRQRTRVVDLLRDRDGRVRGVETRGPAGGSERLRADLVIGADGRHSTIAKLVGAEEYLGYDAPRAVYWAYWRRPDGWNPYEVYNSFVDEDAFVVFPTDDDLLLIGAVPPVDRARTWRRNHVAAYIASLRSHVSIGAAVAEAGPESGVRGVMSTRYFFRASAGPGWALIGDAGHHKEYVIGLGISEALRDARAISEAILGEGPAALERWWRERDVERMEMFHWARDLGRARGVDALQRLTVRQLAAHPHLRQRFGQIIDGALAPYDLVPAGAAARWIGASLVAGEVHTLGPALSALAHRTRARKELRRRRRLLHRVVRRSVLAV